MKKFKTGLQLYSVRGAMEKDFEGTLRAVKDMGYDYVEFAGFFGRTAEEVKKILDDLGLCAISAHQGYDAYASDGDAAVDFLYEIGAKFCAIPWYSGDAHYGTDAWEATKKNFTEYSKALAKKGIKLLYHNHDFEFQRVDGKYKIDHMFSELDGIIDPEFDVCWVKYAGEDPIKYIEKYACHVEVLHLKDFYAEKLANGPAYALIGKDGKEEVKNNGREGFEFRPLGMGMQDFVPILEAAQKAGTEYIIVEQDNTYDTDELEAARISREYLRTLGI